MTQPTPSEQSASPSSAADGRGGTGAGRRLALGSPRHVALADAVMELEEHMSKRGWDAPVAVFALVRTSTALRVDPSLADVLDPGAVELARANPESLMIVEQEDLPASATLEDLLTQLAWPMSVDGVAVSAERIVLPAQAEAEAAAIEDEAEQLAYLESRTDREEVRVVVGALRSNEAWCAVRARSQDSPDAVAQGPDLVPGLAEALRATFI
ncbi:PPA1309 family protein [Actinomyces timonensis]|uniref:PPA1309 family protein n=1 Tax=Actinomyces timonensis TaxID=1288391 RepID=UPI00030B965F|nr:PPA1309 family protein [Actinomyces timonensis]